MSKGQVKLLTLPCIRNLAYTEQTPVLNSFVAVPANIIHGSNQEIFLN